jgi:regulator of cell morphogenesis and NO signaling
MNTFRFGNYRASDPMSTLATEHTEAMTVVNRFGIAIGFGDKTVDEVCRENGVDTTTFLAIVNLVLAENPESLAGTPVAIESLTTYLRRSHTYFLEKQLPEIRQRLTEVLNPELTDLNQAVLDYFDKFVAATRKHMLYENNTVFPTCEKSDFNRQHAQMEKRLKEFKQLFIKYYPAENSYELCCVLRRIFNCEYELALHNAVEDYLLIPALQ